MAGLRTPLSTLHVRPHDRPRMTRGRCGSLLLHRNGLAPSALCRSPGAPDSGRSAAGGLTGQVDPERPLWPRQWIFPSAVKRTFAPDFLYVLIIIGDSTNTSSSASASFRPAVSNP